jgi:hypothetical protein
MMTCYKGKHQKEQQALYCSLLLFLLCITYLFAQQMNILQVRVK